MCTRTRCHPETERFMCPRTCEAMVKTKNLETDRRQNIKGFLCPDKQLELSFEGLQEYLTDLCNLFPYDRKISICLFYKI